VPTGERRGEGIGVIEAPRGNLIHHYEVDENDQVTYCNLIVSTTHNNEGMNRAVRDVAVRELSGKREITEGMLNHVEVAIRPMTPACPARPTRLGRCRSGSTCWTPRAKRLRAGRRRRDKAHRIWQPGPGR
jgi:NAD-reducing hydrogenase large subunit